MATKYDQALVIVTDKDNLICAGAPYAEASPGDIVRVTNGDIGTVVNVITDFDGSARALASAFTTIRTVETIWRKSWSKEESKDA